MAKVIGVDHLVLSVKSVARSKVFYKKVLGFLGFTIKYNFPGAVGFSNKKTMLWVVQADKKGRMHKHRKGEVGFHHYGFELGSRSDVDAFYKKVLVPHKVKVLDKPQDFPAYGRGYYLCNFADPDGMKLEVMVFRPDQVPKAKKR